MKIVILGGAGLTGRCAVRDLVKSPEISEVVVADLDLKKAEQLANAIGSRKVAVRGIDVTKHAAVVGLLRNADVVINAVQYYYNPHIMKAALEARVSYVDLGGLYHMTKKQLEFHDNFKDAGLTAVIGMGAQPGVSNVMARYAADRLDKVDSVLIRDGYVNLTANAPPYMVTWSLETLIEEFSMNAVIFEKGELKELPALSRSETVNFPEPVGKQKVYLTLHSEIATIPYSFADKGIRNVSWMEGWHGFLKTKVLVDVGLAGKDPIEVGGDSVVPVEFLHSLMASKGLLGPAEGVLLEDVETTKVTVTGQKGGKEARFVLDTVFPSRKEWKVSGTQYAVGVPASIVAQMIAAGDISRRGVMPPETCVEPEALFSELKKRGIETTVTVTQRV